MLFRTTYMDSWGTAVRFGWAGKFAWVVDEWEEGFAVVVVHLERGKQPELRKSFGRLDEALAYAEGLPADGKVPNVFQVQRAAALIKEARAATAG
jgi:hypothetical protein